MPWEVKEAVEQRKELIHEWLQDEPIAELSRRYGVSRQTVYKWIERYQQWGETGLQDQPRAPKHHPQQCAANVRERVLELRYQHSLWGPRKLRAYLRNQQPEQSWPSTSTIGEWLRQEALVHRRRKRRRTPPMSAPLAHAAEPNQVWCADFKGWFRTRNGERVDPLTLTDAASRYLLRCVAVDKTDAPRVRAVLEAAFREYGLPQAIRTDNGPPFASPAPAGLSRLALWWIRLGIRQERIEPGEPQQNGRHERFHLTLKQETALPPASTRALQQKVFCEFASIYNQQRPHEALNYQTPASCYAPSSRSFPPRVPEPDYPAGAVLRRITEKGEMRWRGERLFVSEVFGHEAVGLLALDDRFWEMYYGPVMFGWLDAHRRCFHPLHRRPRDLELDQG